LGEGSKVPSDKSILDVVQEAEVEIDSSCGMGDSGTCPVDVVSGGIDRRDFLLREEE
jgi:ferredoxin